MTAKSTTKPTPSSERLKPRSPLPKVRAPNPISVSQIEEAARKRAAFFSSHIKNSWKGCPIFSATKNDCQLTTFTTHFTTISPRNYHAKTAPFLKTPSKIPIKQRKPGSLRGSNFFCKLPNSRTPFSSWWQVSPSLRPPLPADAAHGSPHGASPPQEQACRSRSRTGARPAAQTSQCQ